MPRPTPIRDAAGVEGIVARARAAGRVALDLEFMWERTYAPIPCLAQMAVGDRVELIDPVEGAPLGPVAGLLGDPDVTVVMHAPSADLTLLALCCDARPAALVDVQVTAGFVGLGSGQGLGTLLERVLRVRLAKTEGYTDWARRPLSPAQIAYAAEDVRYLIPLADELARRVEARGRTEWVAEEHARRYGPDARFAPDPEEAWRRVKGQGRLSPPDRAILAALAAWREREARRRDRPVAWLIPDRTLIELARRRPTHRDALARERGVPAGLGAADADAVLAAVREGEARPPIHLLASPPPEAQARLDVLGPLGQVLVAGRAAAAGLAPGLLATRGEIDAFLLAAMDGGDPDHPLGRGWRRELAGAALRKLAAGRLALAVGAGPPYLEEVPRP